MIGVMYGSSDISKYSTLVGKELLGGIGKSFYLYSSILIILLCNDVFKCKLNSFWVNFFT